MSIVTGAAMGGAVEIVQENPEESAKQRTNSEGGDELRGMGEGGRSDLFFDNPENDEADGEEKTEQDDNSAEQCRLRSRTTHVTLIVAAVRTCQDLGRLRRQDVALEPLLAR